MEAQAAEEEAFAKMQSMAVGAVLLYICMIRYPLPAKD